MATLYRLVYTSFRKPTCTDQEIQNILQSCKKNNPNRNVTGILIHSKNRFIQYIEGSEKDVSALYELILSDVRHTAVNRRNFEPIAERIFPSWEMGYFDLNNNHLQFNSDVTRTNKAAFEKIFNADIDYRNTGMKLLQLFNQSTQVATSV